MPAIVAVGGLDVVVVGLCALILGVALFPLLRPLLAGGLSQVPVIGTWLAQNTDLVLFRAYVSALGFISGSVSTLTDLVRRLRYAMVLIPAATIDAVYYGWQATWIIRYRTIPQLAGQTGQLVAQAQATAQAYADYRVSRLATNVGQIMAYLIALTQQTGQAAMAYADYRVSALASSVSQLLAQVIGYVQAQDAQGIAYAQALTASSEGYARSLAGQVLQYAQAGVLDAERYAQRVGVDAEDYARALHDVAIGHADQVAGAAAAAAAASTSAVAARVAEIEESPCQRACNPLGQIGELVQGLEGAGLLSILIGLVVEAERDPRGLQSALQGAFVVPAHDALAALGFRMPAP